MPKATAQQVATNNSQNFIMGDKRDNTRSSFGPVI